MSPCLQWLTRQPDLFDDFTELRRTTDAQIDTGSLDLLGIHRPRLRQRDRDGECQPD